MVKIFHSQASVSTLITINSILKCIMFINFWKIVWIKGKGTLGSRIEKNQVETQIAEWQKEQKIKNQSKRCFLWAL